MKAKAEALHLTLSHLCAYLIYWGTLGLYLRHASSFYGLFQFDPSMLIPLCPGDPSMFFRSWTPSSFTITRIVAYYFGYSLASVVLILD